MMMNRRQLLLGATLAPLPRVALAMGRPFAAPWTPAQIAPSGWWNADDIGLMVNDGAGLISSWTGRLALAVTAATTARPTYSATAWTPNSKPGLTFDGAANCLVTTSLASLPTGATGGEIWALIIQNQAAGVAGAEYVVAYGGTSGATSRYMRRGVSGGINRLQILDGATTVTDTNVDLSGAHIVSGNWAGTTEGGRVDGQTMVDTTIATLNTGTTRLRFGAQNGTGAGNFFLGVIRQVIITPTLSVANRQRMEGYFAWDGWSTAAANPLPATHPYKFAPPTIGT